MSTIADALRAGTARLVQAGIDGAARDARLLMAHAIGVDPGRVTLMAPDPMTQADQFEALITARADRVPVSHLLGYRDFFGRRFAITPDVLDPRPETETLVSCALEAPFARVLDLGTGSGAILLSLLCKRSGTTGIGTDMSEAALGVAERNARTFGLETRVQLIRSDWYGAIEGCFDLIVSNPPYIARGEMAGLAPELAREPRMALTDEADGLSAYRAICGGARRHLSPGGRLLLEIGYRQAQDVSDLVLAHGLDEVRVIRDLNGHNRVISCKNPQNFTQNAN